MTSWFEHPQSLYLAIAIVMLGAAFAIIKWVGRTLREPIGGAGDPRRETPFVPAHSITMPPALVKQAIERGLVTPSQLATMSPTERQFLLASLRDRLDVEPAAGEPAADAPTRARSRA